MVDLEKVKAFAFNAHGEQKYGNELYSKHLIDVYNIICDELNFNPVWKYLDHDVMLAAALCHDVIEDTGKTWDDICNSANDYRVADLVQSVTDEPGKSRKERKARTYPKIQAAGPEAIAIKLADRIANVENCLNNKDSRFGMYFKEHNSFRDALYDPNDRLNRNLWDRFNKLFVMP